MRYFRCRVRDTDVEDVDETLSDLVDFVRVRIKAFVTDTEEDAVGWDPVGLQRDAELVPETLDVDVKDVIAFDAVGYEGDPEVEDEIDRVSLKLRTTLLSLNAVRESGME